MNFESEYFWKDNECSLDLGIKIFRISEKEDVFGVNRSLQMESIGDIPMVYGITNNNIPPQKLVLIRVDKNNNQIEIDNAFRSKLQKWLFTNKVSKIQFDDIPDVNFYGMFTQATRKSYTVGQGYFDIELTFIMPYGLSNPMIQDYTVLKKGEIVELEIENYSNFIIKPILIIENLLDEVQTIKIKNLNDNINMEFKNVPPKSTIEIDNSLKHLESKDFLFNDFNREWLYVNDGITTLSIEGVCNVQFKWIIPVIESVNGNLDTIFKVN